MAGATIIPFQRTNSVDEAWLQYREHAARMVEDRALILDRDYMVRLTILHDRFSRLTVQQMEREQ